MEVDSIVVQRTPVMNRFLQFVSGLDSNSTDKFEFDEDDLQLLKTIREALTPSDKPVYHLILLAFVDDEELQKAFGDEEKVDLLAEVMDMVESEDEGIRISAGIYMDIVIGLGLMEEWISMMMANPRAKFVLDTVAILLPKMNRTEFQESFIQAFMINLAKLVRAVEDGAMREKYFYFLSAVSDCAFGSRSNSPSEADKLILIFRIMGIAMLGNDDYVQACETAELMKEWRLDQGPVDSRYIKIYQTLYKVDSLDWKKTCCALDVLLKLDEVVDSAPLVFSEEAFSAEIDPTYGNKTLSGYIGGCAYIVSLLAEKHDVRMDDYTSLSGLVRDWIQQKPKMKEADFDLDSENFGYFCATMDRFGSGGMEMYKQDWIAKFLTFPAEQVVGTKEGAEIAEKFIIGASQEHVLEYLGKVSQFQFEDKLSYGQREVIVKVLTHKIVNQGETTDMIKKVFCKGTNDKLCLEGFSARLNTLCSQISTIEFEKDSEKLTKHKLEVYQLCVQDPLLTTWKLLEQSVKVEHYRALLEFAEPFFNLVALHTDDGLETQLPDSLLGNSVFKMIKLLPQYPDSLYNRVSAGIELLISKNALSVKDVFALLKYRIMKLLKSKSVVLESVTGMIVLLKEYVKVLIPEEGETIHEKSHEGLIREIGGFGIKLYRFFSLHTNKGTFRHTMMMRDLLTGILDHMKRVNLVELSVEEFKPELATMELFKVGLLYVRCEHLKPLIANMLESDDSLKKLEFSLCMQNTVQWVSNSCESEWASLVKFLFEIVLKFNFEFSQNRFSEVDLLNESLLSMYAISAEMKGIDVFVHMLKFYDFCLNHLEEEGRLGTREVKSTLDTLMTVALAISRSANAVPLKKYKERRFPGLYQVLTSMLSKVQQLKNAGKGDLGDGVDFVCSLALLGTKLDKKCSALRALIGSVVTDGKGPVFSPPCE